MEERVEVEKEESSSRIEVGRRNLRRGNSKRLASRFVQDVLWIEGSVLVRKRVFNRHLL